MNLKVIGFIILISTFCSCASTSKYVYFNNISKSDSIDTSINIPPILVKSGDVLQIVVSTIDREISSLLNPNSSIVGASINNPIQQGYLVDRDGYIELPMAGKIYVRGRSTGEINELIKGQLSSSVKNVFVSTRLVNFKVSILGDVARPGSYNVPNERISILDALSLAGDLNITAVRDDVMLIREVEGKKKFISINMNDGKTLASPYFYLANNDVLYVKPGATRVFGNTTGFRLFPYITGLASLLIVVYATFIRK